MTQTHSTSRLKSSVVPTILMQETLSSKSNLELVSILK